jgi:hypothetical protein
MSRYRIFCLNYYRPRTSRPRTSPVLTRRQARLKARVSILVPEIGEYGVLLSAIA